MIVEDDCNNSKEGSIENTGDFLQIDLLQNSCTKQSTMKYLQQELVKKKMA